MGSPATEPGHYSDEVQHQVTLSSFYMGRTEVTQKEYQDVMGINPSEFKGDNLPVESVSWYDAIEYCNKRSQREGLTPAYTINKSQKDSNNTSNNDNLKWTVTWNRNANGYRLPTEAEWEYACRAGTMTAYNTGSAMNDTTGWYDANSGGQTHPVGQKAANAWGLYDMHGNVAEWCWDWHRSYSSSAQTEPRGAVSGSYRVMRGGYSVSSARELRSAWRSSGNPYKGYGSYGFRLARNGQ
jgi:formylglycine-generating enzyme required for sulfatase activity